MCKANDWCWFFPSKKQEPFSGRREKGTVLQQQNFPFRNWKSKLLQRAQLLGHHLTLSLWQITTKITILKTLRNWCWQSKYRPSTNEISDHSAMQTPILILLNIHIRTHSDIEAKNQLIRIQLQTKATLLASLMAFCTFPSSGKIVCKITAKFCAYLTWLHDAI